MEIRDVPIHRWGTRPSSSASLLALLNIKRFMALLYASLPLMAFTFHQQKARTTSMAATKMVQGMGMPV